MKKTLLITTLVAMLGTMAKAESKYHSALKTTFLSWSTGSVKLFYEHAFNDKDAVTVAAGMIGAAFDKYDNNPKGYLLRAGYKRNVALRVESKPMQGLYLMPELLYSNFRYDADEDPSVRKRSKMWTAMLNIGYQYVWNQLTIDAYWGCGYADGDECDTWYEHGFMLCDMLGIKNKNISLGAGIRVGYALGKSSSVNLSASTTKGKTTSTKVKASASSTKKTILGNITTKITKEIKK